MPSKKLWGYIQKLEKAIKRTMEGSDEIADLVSKIQREGIEVSLNCIALFSDPKGKSFSSSGAEGMKALEAIKAAAEAEGEDDENPFQTEEPDFGVAAAEEEPEPEAEEAPPAPRKRARKKAGGAGAKGAGAKGEKKPAKGPKGPRKRGNKASHTARSGPIPKFHVTDADRDFLREIGIRFD